MHEALGKVFLCLGKELVHTPRCLDASAIPTLIWKDEA